MAEDPARTQPSAEPELATDADFEAFATELLHLDTEHEVAGAVRIGRRVLQRVFRGDFSAVSSTDPTKPDSLTRLGLACRRSRNWLSNRVRVAEQYPRYDEPFRDQVGFSVHVVLLRAPEIERNQLLRQAAIQGLSSEWVGRLIDRMQGIEPATPTRRFEARQLIENGDKLLAQAERATDPAERAEMLEIVQSGEKLLAKAKKILTSPPKPAQTRKRKKPAR